jgi:phage terminase large subunit
VAKDNRNPFDEFLDRYANDPVRFVREMLQLEPDPWQIEVMEAVSRGERRITIRSGHGVGKSALLSWIAIWFVLCRYPAKCVMTAPSSTQLFDALFAELRGQVNNLPPFLKELLVPTTDKVALKAAPDEVFISARTSRAETPEALQGIHSANVLLLVDEASGVPAPVFEAASGSMSAHNATTILTGNPTRGTGFFYDSHTRMADQWRVFHVSCMDSPRVSKEFVEEMKLRYGEDSNAFRVRVLGEFPRSDDDTIISLDLAESACIRDVSVNPSAEIVWGLDVARFGGDRSCLLRRQANVVTDIKVWRNLDLMQLCGAVKAEYDVASSKPSVIAVDAIGMGAGVVDRLRELGLPVLGINVSESPSIGNYRNLRAELWYRARDWLAKRDCKLPKDDTLIAELTSVRYLFSSTGKVQVESKEEMKKRGLPSPDVADALILTFAAPEAIYTNGTGFRWAKEIRRNLPGLV